MTARYFFSYSARGSLGGMVWGNYVPPSDFTGPIRNWDDLKGVCELIRAEHPGTTNVVIHGWQHFEPEPEPTPAGFSAGHTGGADCCTYGCPEVSDAG